jgi:hypothetical protein
MTYNLNAGMVLGAGAAGQPQYASLRLQRLPSPLILLQRGSRFPRISRASATKQHSFRTRDIFRKE